MKAILVFMLLTSFAYLDSATAGEVARSPLCCSICGAPHGNLIGNGICLDCNKREFDIRPEDFGLATHPIEAIQVDGPEESKAMVLAALENQPGAARDIVALNAGAGIYVAGCAPTHAAGVAKALAAIASGAARSKLDEFVAFTKRQH